MARIGVNSTHPFATPSRKAILPRQMSEASSPRLSLLTQEAEISLVGKPSGISRADALYSVHAYHTKIPISAIEPFIVRHTKVGDSVVDPFCGSGMTGVAAMRLRRLAFLSDLSPAAVHIATNYTQPCDPRAYTAAVERVYSTVDPERALYATTCHQCGSSASVAYVTWSDVRRCPECGSRILVWDQRDTGLRRLTCAACHKVFRKNQAPLVGEEPVRVSLDCGQCGRVDRGSLPDDLQVAATPRAACPYWYPDVPFNHERPMWRSGHEELGIKSVADFYSARNLRALAAIWAAIALETNDQVRQALQFTFTAIANRASRRYQWNAQRPTNVLGGTLYVSSLRYEFNVFGLWKRKVAAVRRLLESTYHTATPAKAIQASATALPYPDRSFDYCFTDPPFGANIIYSNSSLLWEAWLGALTDTSLEAVIDQRGRSLASYATLMSRSFCEIRRVLRANGKATVVFQNTNPNVWEAIVSAIADARFDIADVDVLHKVQPSFKGIKGQQGGEHVAASDVVLTLRCRTQCRARPASADPDLIWAALTAELRRPALTNRQRGLGHSVRRRSGSGYHSGRFHRPV